MWKKTRLIILLILAAFFIGSLPTILAFFNDTVVYSVKEGISLHPHAAAWLSSFAATMKHYTWHIIFVYAIITAFIIFMEGQNPDRTLLWMLALIFVPVLGVVAYLVVGPRFNSYKKMLALTLSGDAPHRDLTPFTKDRRYQTGRLLHSSNGAELTTRNKLDVLINGDATFGAIKEELRGAEHFIHMQYFIINDDEIGREIRDILIEAACRGVKVRVLYDAIGSWKLTRKYISALKEAEIECNSFMPVSFARFRRKLNFRNHRKIIVIDGRVAFTGGLNVGDEYLGKGPLGHWRDTHVRVEGEAVAELHNIFLNDWCFRTDDDAEKICEGFSSGVEHDFSELPKTPIQVVGSGINNQWHAIAQGYFSMITRASERVWITTPYLVPGPVLMNAMISAALSGVDVRIIIPEKKDHFLVHWGSRGNILPLLSAGVRVFFYENGFVHTKSLVSDSDICSVGTCNMDVRSLEINFENQLFIYDDKFASDFAAQFEEDMKDCREATLEEWVKRSFHEKVLESFGKLYSAQI
ncbi:MAG: cardiolipin synthase [Synergistaceae bacterium]|nr:cardiolipin synthase [Synergistaceae bacterium]